MILHLTWKAQEWRRKRRRQREEYMAFIMGSPASQRWFNRQVPGRTHKLRSATWG